MNNACWVLFIILLRINERGRLNSGLFVFILFAFLLY